MVSGAGLCPLKLIDEFATAYVGSNHADHEESKVNFDPFEADKDTILFCRPYRQSQGNFQHFMYPDINEMAITFRHKGGEMKLIQNTFSANRVRGHAYYPNPIVPPNTRCILRIRNEYGINGLCERAQRPEWRSVPLRLTGMLAEYPYYADQAAEHLLLEHFRGLGVPEQDARGWIYKDPDNTKNGVSRPNTKTFTVGERVLAKYQINEQWYEGVIEAIPSGRCAATIGKTIPDVTPSCWSQTQGKVRKDGSSKCVCGACGSDWVPGEFYKIQWEYYNRPSDFYAKIPATNIRKLSVATSGRHTS